MDEMRLDSKPKSATVFRLRLFQDLWNNWLSVMLNQQSFNQLNVFANEPLPFSTTLPSQFYLYQKTFLIFNPGILIRSAIRLVPTLDQSFRKRYHDWDGSFIDPAVKILLAPAHHSDRKPCQRIVFAFELC